MSNTYGQNIRLSIFGESHGKAIGMVLDGVEPGVAIDMDKLRFQMKRRAPGGALATSRKEADQVEFVSGILNGKTCASPICGIIANTNTHSQDYANLAAWMRPSHADYPAYMKYHGFNDIRGGGHFSGRLTAPLVAAGEICSQALCGHMPLQAGSHIVKLGSYEEPLWTDILPDVLAAHETMAIPCQDPGRVSAIIEEARMDLDSVGGIVETALWGVPVGLGDPFFDSMESRLSHILFSVPAVKGLMFGAGDRFASMKGSEANDTYYFDNEALVKTRTNHNGGILGGITTGMPIVFRTIIKPTASIGKKQMSVNLQTGQEEEGQIKGRHDPCIVLRAVPVLEAAAKIAVYDAFREGKW